VNPDKPIIFPRHTKSSLEIKTGDWRTFRPEIRPKNSACRAACLIHNRIRDLLQLVKDREFEKAWQILVETNPLPAVLGRVCPKACETNCLRGQFDQPVAINTVEKLLGDMALEAGWKPEGFKELTPRLRLRQRIAIIGAGPAGLSCAYQLRRLGYWSHIFEVEKAAGGMLYFGIPEYRLPKNLLLQEIENNILSLDGIKIHYDVQMNVLTWHHFLCDFDAILIAIGNQKSRKLGIPGEEGNPQVISGLDFLKKINAGKKLNLNGKTVAIVGGGNTAIDASRLAKKIGARSVFILYRRKEEDMPAFQSEIKAAKNEGIEIISLVSPVLIEKRCDDLLRIDCVKMELGEPDKSGRPKPIAISGPPHITFAHNLVVAVGEEPDLSFIQSNQKDLLPENVFLAGDIVSNKGGTVAAAIGSGNKAAQEIDWYLKTGQRKREEIPGKEETIVRFEDLNSEYFEHKNSRLRLCHLTHEQSVLEQLLQEEAERCFSCGDCNSCGNCWLFCPDIAVKEAADGKYGINYDYCKGCGICANECPRNVLDMEREVK